MVGVGWWLLGILGRMPKNTRLLSHSHRHHKPRIMNQDCESIIVNSVRNDDDDDDDDDADDADDDDDDEEEHDDDDNDDWR